MAAKKSAAKSKSRKVTIVRAKSAVSKPSKATGRKPSKRLVARRKANTKKGYFPNPSAPKLTHAIYIAKNGVSKLVCVCPKSTYAKEIAEVLNQHAKAGVNFIVAGSTRYA